jgi:hypothetical protein
MRLQHQMFGVLYTFFEYSFAVVTLSQIRIINEIFFEVLSNNVLFNMKVRYK